MNRVLTSRPWQIAWWGNLFIGGVLFSVCAADLPWVRYFLAFFVAWLTGFLAAVLVEIGTQ